MEVAVGMICMQHLQQSEALDGGRRANGVEGLAAAEQWQVVQVSLVLAAQVAQLLQLLP